MQARDVAVFGEDHVAALAADVHAVGRDGEGVADRVAADDQAEAAEVARVRAAHRLDAVGRLRRGERLEAHDLLADAEHVAVARAGPGGRGRSSRTRRSGCARRAPCSRRGRARTSRAAERYSVARKQPPGVATDRGRAVTERERAALGAVRVDQHELAARLTPCGRAAAAQPAPRPRRTAAAALRRPASCDGRTCRRT